MRSLSITLVFLAAVTPAGCTSDGPADRDDGFDQGKADSTAECYEACTEGGWSFSHCHSQCGEGEGCYEACVDGSWSFSYCQSQCGEAEGCYGACTDGGWSFSY